MNRKTAHLLFIFFLIVLGQTKAVSKLPINLYPFKGDSILWDLKALSSAPAFEWLNTNSPVHSLAFKALDYKGKPTRVFAYYSNPSLLNGVKSQNKKYPCIVLVHGGGGKAFKAWVEKWAADGYAVLALDLSNSGGDNDKFDGNGPLQGKKEKFEDIASGDLKNMWSYHAVADVILAHSLLLSFPEVDSHKTVVTGISWGGYLTCLVASLDNRFKAAAPVYGCGFYGDCVFRSDLAKMGTKDSLIWLKFFDPSSYLRYNQHPILFINGNKDGWFFVDAYHKTYSLVNKERRTVTFFPDMKHSHSDGWAPEEIKCFFESVLNKGYPLVHVGETTRKDSLVKVSFQSNISVTSASFFYSNDLIHLNTNREWIELKASVDSKSKTISCKVPPFKVGFFTLKDVRNLSVSSEYIFNSY